LLSVRVFDPTPTTTVVAAVGVPVNVAAYDGCVAFVVIEKLFVGLVLATVIEPAEVVVLVGSAEKLPVWVP
jgi:hypothetical protein